MARPPRDRFPNAFVGDLVPNGKGWTRVGPLYCPNWHSADEPGWTQRCLPCARTPASENPEPLKYRR
ncbi:hypothetical protein RA990_21245, partial [Mycobacteroides abscessus subsp. abscessus]